MLEPNLVLITFAAVAGASGLALLFVGYLIALLVALGQRQWFWAVLCIALLPAVIYSFIERDKSNYALRLLLAGLALFTLFIGLMYWELGRLGLDFSEVMSSTRPVHSLQK
ncbi:hypothetical protein [Agaribacterium sp. ZY112]|uniref:hypothetical protein n=1 Tax=Agaribacterium sp. ZY112 TaxID=3233574 RepID=UPI0035246070